MLIPQLLSTHLYPLLAQAEDGEETVTLWEMVQDGGAVGYIIIALSIGALALIVMHLVQIRRRALMPTEQVNALDQMLEGGDVNAALEYCLDSSNDSYLTRIMAAGLTRFQKSAFGAFEIKSAIEEAGEDQTARLYRSTDGIGVIGSIAPLLGLLGTVLGMVGAFEALGTSAGADSERLAGEISLALVTTLMGLVLAIPCIALYTYFRNRIDTIASEASLEIERLILHLEAASPTTQSAGSPAQSRAASSRPPGRTTRPSPQPVPEQKGASGP